MSKPSRLILSVFFGLSFCFFSTAEEKYFEDNVLDSIIGLNLMAHVFNIGSADEQILQNGSAESAGLRTGLLIEFTRLKKGYSVEGYVGSDNIRNYFGAKFNVFYPWIWNSFKILGGVGLGATAGIPKDRSITVETRFWEPHITPYARIMYEVNSWFAISGNAGLEIAPLRASADGDPDVQQGFRMKMYMGIGFLFGVDI